MQYRIHSLNLMLLYLSWRERATAIIHQNYIQFPPLFDVIPFRSLIIGKITFVFTQIYTSILFFFFLILCVLCWLGQWDVSVARALVIDVYLCRERIEHCVFFALILLLILRCNNQRTKDRLTLTLTLANINLNTYVVWQCRHIPSHTFWPLFASVYLFFLSR